MQVERTSNASRISTSRAWVPMRTAFSTVPEPVRRVPTSTVGHLEVWADDTVDDEIALRIARFGEAGQRPGDFACGAAIVQGHVEVEDLSVLPDVAPVLVTEVHGDHL